eukprot:scaffold203059_cov32-Tisochrysis_lutea.AAC.3
MAGLKEARSAAPTCRRQPRGVHALCIKQAMKKSSCDPGDRYQCWEKQGTPGAILRGRLQCRHLQSRSPMPRRARERWSVRGPP